MSIIASYRLRGLAIVATPALLANFASAALDVSTGIVTGTNQISVAGATSVQLNGLSFVNQGLVGVGRMSAGLLDAWGESFGSVSSLQITNWQNNGNGSYSGSFATLPDRGYNSGTTFSNYAARIQSVDFTFTPYYGDAPTGQNQILLSYNASNSKQFTYDLGNGPTTTTGLVPDSSTTLAGKAVPYVTISSGSTVNKISIDAEGLVLKSDGSGYVSDEYGPNIYRFNANKEIVGVITPPAAIQPHNPVGTLSFTSETDPKNGRRGNQGMEGLALSPSGTRLFGLEQSATIQDSGSGNQGRLNTRLLVYDVSQTDTPGKPIAEYVLRLPILNDTGAGAPNKTAAQSEIVAIDDTHILVLSRDGNGKGATSSGAPVFKSVLLVDLTTATNIAGLFDNEGDKIVSSGTTLKPGITPLSWNEALNMLNAAQLAKFGLNLNAGSAADLNTISEKWEGMSLVSANDADHPNDFFLFLANDNDFISSATKMVAADGSIATYDPTNGGQFPVNDTMFLAYRVTIAPVPEPTTYGLAGGFAVLALAGWRRLRRRK